MDRNIYRTAVTSVENAVLVLYRNFTKENIAIMCCHCFCYSVIEE